jgi:hypothetical protein
VVGEGIDASTRDRWVVGDRFLEAWPDHWRHRGLRVCRPSGKKTNVLGVTIRKAYEEENLVISAFGEEAGHHWKDVG